jgi:hypothetical protein
LDFRLDARARAEAQLAQELPIKARVQSETLGDPGATGVGGARRENRPPRPHGWRTRTNYRQIWLRPKAAPGSSFLCVAHTSPELSVHIPANTVTLLCPRNLVHLNQVLYTSCPVEKLLSLLLSLPLSSTVTREGEFNDEGEGEAAGEGHEIQPVGLRSSLAMARSKKTATPTRSASEDDGGKNAGPRLRFGLVWTFDVRCSFFGTGHRVLLGDIGVPSPQDAFLPRAFICSSQRRNRRVGRFHSGRRAGA